MSAGRPVTCAVQRSAAAMNIAGVRKVSDIRIDSRAFKALCRECDDIEHAEHVEISTCIGMVRVWPIL